VNEALPRPVVLSKGMPSTRPADVRAPEAEACAGAWPVLRQVDTGWRASPSGRLNVLSGGAYLARPGHGGG
jgi:hypothetical protein